MPTALRRHKEGIQPMIQPKIHFLICLNERPAGNPKGCCHSKGSKNLYETLRTLMQEKGLKGIVKVSGTTCLGPCQTGPNLVVYPEGKWYHNVTPHQAEQIFLQHIAPICD